MFQEFTGVVTGDDTEFLSEKGPEFAYISVEVVFEEEPQGIVGAEEDPVSDSGIHRMGDQFTEYPEFREAGEVGVDLGGDGKKIEKNGVIFEPLRQDLVDAAAQGRLDERVSPCNIVGSCARGQVGRLVPTSP